MKPALTEMEIPCVVVVPVVVVVVVVTVDCSSRLMMMLTAARIGTAPAAFWDTLPADFAAAASPSAAAFRDSSMALSLAFPRITPAPSPIAWPNMSYIPPVVSVSTSPEVRAKSQDTTVLAVDVCLNELLLPLPGVEPSPGGS